MPLPGFLIRTALLFATLVLAACQPNTPVNQDEIDAFSAMELERGKHYEVLDQALELGMDEPVTIAEFFWYGCSHCLHLEAPLNKWLKRLPPDVGFIKIPAMWSELMEVHARAHFITENMRLDSLQQSLFELVMSQGDQRDLQHHRSVLRQQFVNFYVEAEEFDKRWDSDQINTQIEQAKGWQKQAKVAGTPTLVINGRYVLVNSELETVDGLLHAASKMTVALLKLQRDAEPAAD